jgi:hypothetical protein
MQNEYETSNVNFTDKDIKNLQPEWKNPPKIVDLRNDLTGSMPSHMIHINKVNQSLSSLRADINFKKVDGRSSIQPKLIRKQNEWRYSSLEEPFLSTNDMFKVNPVTHLDVDAARQNEMILNKQFRVDIPRIKFINKFIRTAVNTGTVIIKLAWETQTGIVNEEQMQPIFAQTPEEFMQFGMQLIQSGQLDEPTLMQLIQSGQFTQIPIGEEPVTVEVEKTYINRPCVEIKDSRNVIIDPSCEGRVEDAQFIIDKSLTDLSTLKKDGRYSNLDSIIPNEYDTSSFDSNEWDYEYRTDKNFQFQDKARKKLVLYEYWGYWDINDDGVVVPIVASWVNNVMIRLEENPYPDKKLPFVVCQYLPPDVNTVHGDSDASLIEDNQAIIGAVTRGMIDLMGRTANAQTGIRKDLLDPINMDRYKKGLDFEYNAVNNVGDAIFTTKMPELPRSAMEMIQYQNTEAQQVSGVVPFAGGVSSGSGLGVSATAVNSSVSASARRELGILRRLADGIKEMGQKIISMNSVWLSDEEIIRTTDMQFIAIKRDDLAGNFDLTVDVSTAESDNVKAQELAFMLQTIGQTVPFDILKIILSKIADLRKLPDLAEAIRAYSPQPDPMAQAKAEAEVNLINAQAQKEASAVPKNIADEALKYAKAVQAQGSARVANSNADTLDLNYLEQSSGLKQDRDIEKIMVQEQQKALNKPQPSLNAMS